jgi:hypothetical protein
VGGGDRPFGFPFSGPRLFVQQLVFTVRLG